MKKIHDSQRYVRRFKRQQDNEEPRNFSIKLCVTVEKSDDEIKNILQDAATLIKLNLGSEFQKAELVGQQVLIHCNGTLLKSLIGTTHCWLGPLAEMVKVSFETKSAYGLLLESVIFPKYTMSEENFQ